MDHTMQNDQLCHYGVKGMKWGVRKSDRVRSWKQRQHNRLDNYTRKDQTRFDKKIARTKALIKNKGSTAARKEKLRTLEGKKQASKALNKIGHEKLSKLTSKDYDAVIMREVVNVGASAASYVLASAGVLPIYMVHIPNTNLNMDKYRVKHGVSEEGVAV